MPNHGPLCKDVIGCNIQIKGKKIIDESGNFKTPGALKATTLTSRGDATVCGTLRTDAIEAKDASSIDVSSELCVTGNVKTQQAYYVDGQQVVTSPQLDPGNTTGNLESTSDTCNLILQVLRTHGLIISP